MISIKFYEYPYKILLDHEQDRETKLNLKNLNYNLPFHGNYSLTTISKSSYNPQRTSKKKRKKERKLIKKNGLILSERGGGGDIRNGRAERENRETGHRYCEEVVRVHGWCRKLC